MNIRSTKQKTIAYGMIGLLLMNLLFGNVQISFVNAAENDEDTTSLCNVEVSNGGIANDAVIVTYHSQEDDSWVEAYRKVTRVDEDSSEVIVEGIINMEHDPDTASYQLGERFFSDVSDDTEDGHLVSDGEYTVLFYLQDEEGNKVEETEQTVSFTIDSVPPTVVLTCDNLDGMAVDEVTCRLKATDSNYVPENVHVYVTVMSLDGEEESSQIDNVTFENDVEKEFAFEEEGKYSVYAQVEDAAGNITTSDTVRFVIDKSAPYVSIQVENAVDNNVYSTQSEDLNVTIDIEDLLLVEDSYEVIVMRNEETVDVDYAWSGTAEKKTTTLVFDGNVEDGNYDIQVVAKDAFDREASKTLSFVIDKTMPDLTIAQMIDGEEQPIAENQLFKSNDNHVLRFSAKDEHHNKASYQIRIERQTDASATPRVTLLAGSNLAWQQVDGTDTIYYENSALFQEEGRYKVTMEGKDLAGNVAVKKQVTFYIDDTAPVISQTSAIENGAYYEEGMLFQGYVYDFNYEEVTATMQISHTFDGVTEVTNKSITMMNGQTPFSYMCEDEGAYTITITATDKAGNEAINASDPAKKGYTIHFVVDKTAPELKVEGVSDGFMTKESVALEFQATDRSHDIGSYEIQIIRSDANGELERNKVIGNQFSIYDIETGWDIAGYTEDEQAICKAERRMQFDKEGIYQIIFKGVDRAGNVAAMQTISFSIDHTAPTIGNVTYSDVNGLIAEKYQNIYSKEDIRVEFTVKDTVVGVDSQRVYVTIGDVVSRNDASAIYTAHKSTGDNYYVYIPADLKVAEFADTITIWANDRLNNESQLTSFKMVHTTAKPDVDMDCNVDYKKWTNKNVTFHTTVTDNVAGLKQVMYKVNGKIVKQVEFKELTYSYEYDLVASEDASKVTGYEVSVEVINNCDISRVEQRQVYIDKTKPVVKLSGIEKGTHYRTNQMITTDVSDVSYKDTKTVYYITRTLDGKSQRVKMAAFRSNQYEDNCVRKIKQEGRYKIYAVTTDGAGNVKKSNTLSFVIDKTAPKLNISGVTAGAMSGDPITLQLECVESFYNTNEVSVKIEKELDGNSSTREISNFPKNGKTQMLTEMFSEDGTYTVTITAKDKAGNEALDSTITFSVDRTKPNIRIEGTDNYQLWSQAPTVQFVVEESYYAGNQVSIIGTRMDIDGNKEQIDIPDMASVGRISSLTQSFEKDGIYEIQVMSKDQAGNEDSKIMHFIVDRAKPLINGVTQYDGGYYQSFQLANSLDDVFKDLTVVTYQILLNGVEYNGTDLIEEEGKYNLYVKVADELGHQNIQNVEFVVDHTPPKIIFTGVKDSEIVTDSGEIALALADEEDTITGIRMNGVEYDTDVRSLAYTEYGSYKIEVDCVDKAGNEITRELYFVYSNPMVMVLLVVGLGGLMCGVCIWLWSRARKKEKGK